MHEAGWNLKRAVYPFELHSSWRSRYKDSVATATNNVHLASARRRSPGQGTGTWISEEPSNDPDLSRPEVRPAESGWRFRQACPDLSRRFLRQVIKA